MTKCCTFLFISCLAVYLSVCLSICLSVCLSVFLFVCLFHNYFFSFSKNRWALCPKGYYLNGMRISGKDYLSRNEEARCCRPQNHPNAYEDCYDEVAGLDWSECKQAGYYMAGFYKGGCNKFDCIDKLRCCKMKTGNFILLCLRIID